MEVVNEIVGKNLKIYQNDEYFKFSLEAILLPSFVNVKLRDKKILDLCTGNAPIPLILSEKTKAEIYGVELQKEIYDLAVKSVKINNKEQQIKIINYDVKKLKDLFKGENFDIITVNPPYFKTFKETLINQNDIKAKARHESTLNLEELLSISSYLLKTNASFYMVHRTERLIEILDVLRKYRLMPKRIKFIHAYSKKEAKLFLIEAVKNGHNGLKVEDSFYIYNQDLSYNQEIQELFK